MGVAYPVRLLETSTFKNTYSSLESTAVVRRVEPLVEEDEPLSNKTIFNDTTTKNITTHQYIATTNLENNSKKSFSKKTLIMSIIVTTNIIPVSGSDSPGVILAKPYHEIRLVDNSIKEINSNTKTETASSSIEGKGIELEEQKSYTEGVVTKLIEGADDMELYLTKRKAIMKSFSSVAIALSIISPLILLSFEVEPIMILFTFVSFLSVPLYFSMLKLFYKKKGLDK